MPATFTLIDRDNEATTFESWDACKAHLTTQDVSGDVIVEHPNGKQQRQRHSATLWAKDLRAIGAVR